MRLDRKLAYTALRKINIRNEPDVSYIQKTATIRADLCAKHVKKSSYVATHREGGVVPGWCINWDTNKKPIKSVVPECALSGIVLVFTEEVRSDPEDYYAKVLTEWNSERVDEWFDMLTDEAVIIIRKFCRSKNVNAYVKFDWSVGLNDTDKITKAVQALVNMLS